MNTDTAVLLLLAEERARRAEVEAERDALAQRLEQIEAGRDQPEG